MTPTLLAVIFVGGITAIFAVTLGLVFYKARQVQSFWLKLPILGFRPIAAPEPELQDRLSILTGGGEALNLNILDRGAYRLYLFQILRVDSSGEEIPEAPFAAAIRSVDLLLPRFSLLPCQEDDLPAERLSSLTTILSNQRLQPLPCPGFPELASRFGLYAGSPPDAAYFFTASRLDRIEQHVEAWYLQGQDDLLIFERLSLPKDALSDDARLQAAIADAGELFAIFGEGVTT
jgi:hypothetical protein